MDHGKSYSVYFCDPWGNRYELIPFRASDIIMPPRLLPTRSNP